jgi:hypothetical protein
MARGWVLEVEEAFKIISSGVQIARGRVCCTGF